MSFRRALDPGYKARRQRIAQRREAARRRLWQQADPPILWLTPSTDAPQETTPDLQPPAGRRRAA